MICRIALTLLHQIKCIGQKPNSHLVPFLSPDTFSRSGHVRVQSSLQVADEKFPHIYAAGDVIEVDGFKNARAAFQQGQIVAENISRSIRGTSFVEYRPEWWEGTTKLTLGIVSIDGPSVLPFDIIQAYSPGFEQGRSVAYITDHRAEVRFSMNKQKVELDSAMVWKYLGQKPFIDPDEKLARA